MANGPGEKDPREDCSICLQSLYYETDDDGKLINKKKDLIPIKRIAREEDLIAVDDEGNPINESEREKLIPLDNSEITTLKCGHKFHENCFQGWLTSGSSAANTCPMCRGPHDIPIPPQSTQQQNAKIGISYDNYIE